MVLLAAFSIQKIMLMKVCPLSQQSISKMEAYLYLRMVFHKFPKMIIAD